MVVLEPGGGGGLVVVVDQHHLPAGLVEDRGGDGGAVARAPVDPHLALGNLAEAVGEFVQGDVLRFGDEAAGALVVAAGVEDLHRSPLQRCGQFREVGDTVGAQRPPVGEVVISPVAAPARSSTPIRTSSRRACATCSAVSPTSVSGVP